MSMAWLRDCRLKRSDCRSKPHLCNLTSTSDLRSYDRTHIPFSGRPRMGTAAPASCLGHPAAAPALVALRTFLRADDVQHNGRRRSHAVQLSAPTTGVFVE